MTPYQAEHLNTPRLVADASGTTVWKWEQVEAFGANAADEDPDSNTVTFEMPLRLPGQYFDKETTLHYNTARDYWPGGGRYIESDPIGLPGGLNAYAYGISSPLRFVDPLGLYCLSDTAINVIGGGVAGAVGGGIAGYQAAGPQGAIGLAVLGAAAGATVSYLNVTDPLAMTGIGAISAAAGGLNTPIASLIGGLFAGSSQSQLQINGVPNALASISGGGIGGGVAGIISSYFSGGKVFAGGGVGLLAGVAASAAGEGTMAVLRYFNDCRECPQTK